MSADLRLGRWQDVMSDVEVDATITDPPFGAKTHSAWRSGGAADKLKRGAIKYACWTPKDVEAFVAHWSPRTRGWMVALTSHDLWREWQRAYEANGRYAFAPIPCVTIGGSIRLSGDGPSSWSVYAMVARPRTREMQAWGTLPGAYVMPGGMNVHRHLGGGGRGKSPDLMRALVRDYSRPGDLVADQCAGLGTTGLVALSMGRRFVGAECDQAVHADGLARLSRVQPVDLFDPGRARQPDLGGLR